MKKFMKGCAITALVLLIVGFVMAIVAGTVEGATTVKDVVSSVTGGKVHVNLGDFGNDEGWGIFFGEDNSTVNYDITKNMIFDKAYDIFYGDVEKYAVGSDITAMDIEAGGCVFRFRESKDDKFYVEATGTGKFQCFVRNNTLFVKTTRTLIKWNDYDDCEVVLYIPANTHFEQVDIELGAGALQIKDIEADKIQLEVGAGQIEADYLQTDHCEVKVGMGEILINDMLVKKMDAEVGMGHLMLDGTILGNADVECSMGAIEMQLTGAEEDFNYKLEAAMGDVSIGGSDYSGLAHERTVKNGADKNMSIECAMGSIEVDFED